MKILLTGATGLVGQALGQKLVAEGHEVVALVRDPVKARRELSYPAELFQWDGAKAPPNQKACLGIEGVIHLAGEPIAGKRWSQKRKIAILESRTLSTRNLIQGLKDAKAPLKVFLSASAMGIYGDRADEVLTEDASHASDFLGQVCEKWEAEALNLSKSFPTARLAIFRISLVLAGHGGFLKEILPIFQQGTGGVIGSGKQWMSWIHLEDLVRLLTQALRQNQFLGIYNASAGEPIQNEDFTKVISKILKVPAVFPVPKFALNMIFGEMAGLLYSSQRMDSKKLRSDGFEFKYPGLIEALPAALEGLGPGEYIFLSEQWLPKKVEELFPFYENEKNLERITPPLVHFKVLGKSTEKIQKGTLIDYSLKIRGVPVKWRTLIEEWRPNQVFVDTQVKGPYKKWHHTHQFIPLGRGTLVRDKVIFKLPLGYFGSLFGGAFVRGDVQKIFTYRAKVIDDLFHS